MESVRGEVCVRGVCVIDDLGGQKVEDRRKKKKGSRKRERGM